MDRDDVKADPVEKAKLAWTPMPHDPSRWKGKGLPPGVEKMMVEGAVIDTRSELGAYEVA